MPKAIQNSKQQSRKIRAIGDAGTKRQASHGRIPSGLKKSKAGITGAQIATTMSTQTLAICEVSRSGNTVLMIELQ